MSLPKNSSKQHNNKSHKTETFRTFVARFYNYLIKGCSQECRNRGANSGGVRTAPLPDGVFRRINIKPLFSIHTEL